MAFFVEEPPNCALACHAPATCACTRCPHFAGVSLCRTAENAAEVTEGEVPVPDERNNQGKGGDPRRQFGFNRKVM